MVLYLGQENLEKLSWIDHGCEINIKNIFLEKTL